MGLRFRKSLKFGPFRLNFSKSGVGYSYGVKGYRVTHKAGGGVRKTASIPGTGISYVTETSDKKSKPQKQAPTRTTFNKPSYEAANLTYEETVSAPQQKPAGKCAQISGRDGVAHYVRFIPCQKCKTEILETSVYCFNCKAKFKHPKRFLDSLPIVNKPQAIKQPFTEELESVVEPVYIAENVEIKKLKIYPSIVDGHPLQYHYRFQFDAEENVNVLNDILQGEEKIVDVAPNGIYIELIYNGKVFGRIENQHKAEMLSDWNYKNLPANAILFASGNEVDLRFYEDKRIRNAWREQDVFSLVGYKTEEAQDVIGLLSEGEQLEFDAEFSESGEDDICVYSCGQIIGKFPKKFANKANENDVVYVFVETIEHDEHGDFYKPYVRVFW